MSRFCSIDPVGILNAWTTKVRMKSARITAMTIDSKYSRRVDFLKVVSGMLAQQIFGHGDENTTETKDTKVRLSRSVSFVSFVFMIRTPSVLSLGPHLQHGEKGLLRNIDLSDALHALLAFLLLLEQL